MGQDAVPVRPAARRLAGPAPAERIPSTPGRETRCPIRTRSYDARENANATGEGRSNAGRWAFVQNAAGETPRLGEVSARSVSKEAGPPNAPDTRGPGLREQHTADAVPRAAGAWRARGTGSSGARVRKPGYASVAANFHPRRVASYASPAARRGARKRGNSTPKNAPGGNAAGAVRKSSTRLPRAPGAPRWMQNAVRARTPRAGHDIMQGAPAGRVLTAAPMRTQG